MLIAFAERGWKSTLSTELPHRLARGCKTNFVQSVAVTDPETNQNFFPSGWDLRAKSKNVLAIIMIPLNVMELTKNTGRCPAWDVA